MFYRYDVALFVLFFLPLVVWADPGTAFTYQGRLANGSTPIETAVDLRFSLWDGPTTGSQVGSDIAVPNQAYDGGIVQAPLDFGAGAFAGDPRWLEIEVRDPADLSGLTSYTLLSNRVQLAPVPYAIYAETAGSSGSGDGHSLDAVDGAPVDALFIDPDGDVGIGTTTPSEALTVEAGNILQTPADPVLVGSLGIGNFPVSVYVSGRYAYVVDNTFGSSDLKVIDISDPASPALTGSLGIGNSPQSVYVSGRYAYVVDSLSNDLKVIDISDPASPTLAGSAGTGSASYLYVSGRYVYITNFDAGVIRVFDISNPLSPTQTGALGIGRGASDIYVSGRYAYVVNSISDDLKVIDISDPASPALTGSLSIGVDADPTSVFVSGRYAYVVSRSTIDLKVIDISDPASPALVSSLGIGTAPQSVYVSGRYAYVVDAGSNDLKVIDISGGEMTSLIAHSLEAGNLQVRNDIIAQGQLQVTGGITAGAGGIFSDGDLAVNGSISGDGSGLTGIDLDSVLTEGNDAGGNNITNAATISANTINAGSPTATGTRFISVTSQNDANLSIIADTDNVDESDNPSIFLSQDNAAIRAIIGLVGNAGNDPLGDGYSNTINNAMLVGTKSVDMPLQFGVEETVVMTIDGEQQVGIGLTNATAKLEVNGAANDSLRIRNSSSTPWALRIENDTAPASFEAGMYVTNSGFFRVTNQVPVASRNYAELDSAGNWTAVSDARRKTGLTPLKEALAKALNLDPVLYYFKDTDGNAWGDQQLGFTAQDVEAEFPSLVNTSEDLKTLNYSGLSVVAIAALQELKAQKDAEIEKLEQKNAELEARLERLEALIGDEASGPAIQH